MTPKRETRGRACLAVVCTRDGTICEIVSDDLDFARSGWRFPEVVDAGSAEKAEKLVATLAAGEPIVGWQLNAPVDGGARTLYFAGAMAGDAMLILAAPALAGMDNQLYEELSRLNNELINREREIARKNAALERLSAEKGRVVAMAAHDLRNPLTVIASYADLLKTDRALEGEHLMFVEEIARSAHFMMELVEEMLDSAAMESGHLELDLQDLDLVAAAAHAATINRVRAERKEIAIVLDSQVESAYVRADPVKMRQIINNLVVNAIKFSPSRTAVMIRVRRDAGRAVLEVEDQGIGIPREKLAAIFEPFRTLGTKGTAGERSTGLGLSIVKQLAELHHATIEVESELRRGSLFRVAFPLTR